MNNWPYLHFTEQEMRCKCGHCTGLPKAEFMEKLEALRIYLAFPLIISSGYRCPEYNSQVSTSGLEGPHTLALAADIQIYGTKALELVEAARDAGMTGIGVSQKSFNKQSRYIHVDCVHNTAEYPRPWIWSY